MRSRYRRQIVGSAAALALIISSAALAGPPYATDDPEPTDTGHWENYIYASGIHTPSESNGSATLELNYGAAHNLQLSMDVPVDYEHAHGTRFGGGGVGLGAKYRFLNQDGGTPDAAFYPQLTLPSATARFGARHVQLLLPIWLQWDAGKWSTFGGGGYEINPGAGNKDYGLVGWAVSRSLTPDLVVGAEIYRKTAESRQEPSSTNIGIGFSYAISEHIAILASGGPGIARKSKADLSTYYASIEFTR